MAAKKLREFLDAHNVPYITITHSPAYTAQGIAHSAHVSGKMLAKTVILKADDQLVMAVLPATCKVDTEAFRRSVGAAKVQVAQERDFKDAFPGCEVGAMPPFGNLWNVPVYVEKQLTEDEEIAFNAGSHTELVQMPYSDFERLVKPQVIELTYAVA